MKDEFVRAEFIKSAVYIKDYPDTEGLPEVAFVGRSNVGKSSMINTLLGRKKLVKVGKTPGKTRLLNFFNVEERLVFVDLPGYGFAKVSKSEKKTWGETITRYLESRKELVAVVIILDVRRVPSDDDMEMLDMLDQHNIPCILALSKCDKLGGNQISKQMKIIQEVTGAPKEAMIKFSSHTGRGSDELWEAVEEAVS